MEQPLFGRRLKELRAKRGLSQAALAGEEISTGYLSRLESGLRQPTDRVVGYLAGKLDVDRSAFDLPPSGNSLAQALSIATSMEGDEAVEGLLTALESGDEQDPLQRWQALWLVARHWRTLGDRPRELACLQELAAIGGELALPELQCRAWTQLARFERSAGEIDEAIGHAAGAHRLAKESGLSVLTVAGALLALVSAEAEAGRLPDARAHVDELLGLVGDRTDALRAEALWAAATVRYRQGDHEGAIEHLERAIEWLDSRVDLTLWMRLRLAGASLALQLTPPRTELARARMAEAESALALVGTPMLRQEFRTLQAYLAFEEGRHADARAAHDELFRGDLRLTYRDQIRLSIMNSRLLIIEGRRSEGIKQLKELAEQARQASNIDLAAEVWRILAEILEEGPA
ncbi:helix-turn-helix domain-containing protein [Kitasatospora sp. NPDC004745]|uniref:helix-turn-helix domain-containing protein n=1 Tax=Kitasatospora sp. NPDC004745 TaxID=3364019 RepID=UPI0036ABF53B